MRNVRLTLQYDGTNYHGWQVQARDLSIQQVLQDRLASVTGEGISLIGAGRTDAGVHALGQVAAFKTATTLPAATIAQALNATIPRDIRVTGAADVHEAFHPRHDARGKVYFYLVAQERILSPFLARYTWQIPWGLDVATMREATHHLLGRQDFSAFRASGCGARTTSRTIRALQIEELATVDFLTARLSCRILKFVVEADAFLRHMVRTIVGTLAEVGRGRMTAEMVKNALLSRNRTLAGPTAPPQGLFLDRIIY